MEVKVIRSRRKSLMMQVMPDCSILIKAPLNTSDKTIEELVLKKQHWLNKQLAKLRKRIVLSEAEIAELKMRAKSDIGERVAHYAEIIGVTYGRITIRKLKSRWGSCNAAGDLSFNCLLMLASAEVRDYVVIHELCHRLQMNHSAKFWGAVACYCPDYKLQRKWLRDNGPILIQR